MCLSSSFCVKEHKMFSDSSVSTCACLSFNVLDHTFQMFLILNHRFFITTTDLWIKHFLSFKKYDINSHN